MWWPFGHQYPERRPEEAHARSYDYVVIGGMCEGALLLSSAEIDRAIASVVAMSRAPSPQNSR